MDLHSTVTSKVSLQLYTYAIHLNETSDVLIQIPRYESFPTLFYIVYIINILFNNTMYASF